MVLYRTAFLPDNADNSVSNISKRRLMFKIATITLAATLTLAASAQAQAQTQIPADSANPTPTYRMNVVSGATKINFQGTDLMPSATGEAKVNSKRGTMTIEAEFSGLEKPTKLGSEY